MSKYQEEIEITLEESQSLENKKKARNKNAAYFSIALQHPEYFELLQKEGLFNNHISDIVNEIVETIKETGEIPELGLFDLSKYPINENMVVNEGTIRQLNKKIRAESIRNSIYNQLEPGEEADWNIDLDNWVIKLKSDVYEYGSKVENEIEISGPDDIKDLVRRSREKEEKSLLTGYTNINNILGNNGWKVGSTYCVMGLSGVGKSIFLTNFARQLWRQEYNVLYISTEMDDISTNERIFKAHYKVKTLEEVGIKAVKDLAFPTAKIKTIKVHPNDTTCNDIQKIIDNLKWTPDAIIIDYLDEIRSTEATQSEYDKHGFVSSDMKKLAEVNGVPVLTATQTNRGAAGEGGGTKSYVGMESIADSSKKVRTLDVLFSIIQEAGMKDLDIKKGGYQLQVIKNRFDSTGVSLDFLIDYKTMRIDEGIFVPKGCPPSDTRLRKNKNSYYTNDKKWGKD